MYGKGDFAHDVDPPHRIVEFDAVDDCDFPVDTSDVAEMQVAVALADEPATLSLDQCSANGCVLALGPSRQGLELRDLGGIRQKRAELGEVLWRKPEDAIR